MILNKVWLIIGIFVLISGVLFAYIAYFSARLENKQDGKCRTSADASSGTPGIRESDEEAEKETEEKEQ